MSRSRLLLVPSSLAAAAVIGFGAISSPALAACQDTTTPAVYEARVHPAVYDDVAAVSHAEWRWSRLVPTTEAQYTRTTAPASGTYDWTRTTPTIESQYSKTVVTQEAQPAVPPVPPVPEVGHWENVLEGYHFVQQTDEENPDDSDGPGLDGHQERCKDDPTWNSGSEGTGWILDGMCDIPKAPDVWVVDSPAIPGIPGIPAVPELTETLFEWVAQGGTPTAGYTPTGGTRPGADLVESVTLADDQTPSGDGWVKGAFTQTTDPIVELFWLLAGAIVPDGATPTGETRPGTPDSETTATTSTTPPEGDGWAKVAESEVVVVDTPATQTLVTAEWTEQVVLTPETTTRTCEPDEIDPIRDEVPTAHQGPVSAGLPNTGTDLDPWMLGLGGALVLGGARMVFGACRRD